MICTAHLAVPTGLACTRTDEHDSGHCYESTSGVPDAHTESSHE